MSTSKEMKRLKSVLEAVAVGLLLIACVALWGMADTATHQTMNERADAVARCKSIDGAEWGGDACYYNGIKLNFKEDNQEPEE